MKTNDLRGFIEDLLVAHGAEIESGGAHLLRVSSPGRLGERIGRRQLVLAFNQRGLEADPSSELATVGNPVFDRILELAQESGRLGIRFAPVPSREKPARPEELLVLGEGRTLGESVPSYAPVYVHVFKVQYSVEETPDALEIVEVDGLTDEASGQSPDLVEQWGALDREPASGRRVPAVLPVPEGVVQAALAALERRLRRRVGRLRRDAESHLSRERDSIGTYYQNLIDETRTSRRRYAGGLQAREEKVRILQLDWKRRMEEAQEFWRPRVEIELTAVGVILRPTLEFPLREGTTVPGKIHFDPVAGRFLVPGNLSGVTLRDRR